MAIRMAKKQTNNSKKKQSLHVQHTFCTQFFVIVLHDQTMKLPSYTYFMEKMLYFLTKNFVACVPAPSFFPCCSFFILLATSISHFLTAAAIKFSCYSSSKIVFL